MNVSDVKPGDLLCKRGFMTGKTQYYSVIYVNEISKKLIYQFFDVEIVMLNLINNFITTIEADGTWELRSTGYEKV